METMENNLPSATHQEKAKKMKKLRRWQIAISLFGVAIICLLYTSPSPRDAHESRMPSSA